MRGVSCLSFRLWKSGCGSHSVSPFVCLSQPYNVVKYDTFISICNSSTFFLYSCPSYYLRKSSYESDLATPFGCLSHPHNAAKYDTFIYCNKSTFFTRLFLITCGRAVMEVTRLVRLSVCRNLQGV